MKGHIIARFSLPKKWLVKNRKKKKKEELMHTDSIVVTWRKGAGGDGRGHGGIKKLKLDKKRQ